MGKLGSCGLYLNKERGVFYLESGAENSELGLGTSYGDLKEIMPEEMGRNGLAIVLDDLAEYRRRKKTEKSELENMSPRQRRDFLQSHWCVGFWLESTKALMMAPMHPQRRGFASEPSEHIRISLPTSQTVFYSKLLEAFSKCK
jgi:hypothetical protein